MVAFEKIPSPGQEHEIATGGDMCATDNTKRTKLIASFALFVVTLLCGYVPVRVLIRRAFIQQAMFMGAGVLLATAFCHLLPEAHDGFPKKLEPKLPYTEITLCVGFLFMYALEQVVLAKLVYIHAHDHQFDLGAPRQAPEQVPVEGANSTSVSGLATNDNLAGSRGLSGSRNVFNFIRGFMIVSAFSVHSIFDGVAIGSQDSAPKVWTIFGAICCHKLIIAAVVGLELFAATLKSHLWTLIHLAIFSIMSPIGIVLMVVAQNSIDSHSSHTIMILLQSFATGTLIYIIFIEILQPKKDEHLQGGENRIGKCLSLIMGFALMLAVLTLIDDGDED